jgi:hypothetical protein
MARVKVHPYFYENYRKGEFNNICPICGTEGFLSITLKLETNIYSYLKLQKGEIFPLKKEQLDIKTTPTIRCNNCEMSLLHSLMRGDTDAKDLEPFHIQRPIKTREVIDRLDHLMND